MSYVLIDSTLIVITQFWVTPKFYFPFLQKKKNLHGAVLNGTVQLLLPCKCRDRGQERFWNIFSHSLFTPHLPKKPGTTHTHTYLATRTEKKQDTHASATIPCKHLPSPTLHCATAGVRWPSPPLAYKYQRRNHSKRGGEFWRRREANDRFKGGKLEKNRRKKGEKQESWKDFFERESEGDRERETVSFFFGEKKRWNRKKKTGEWKSRKEKERKRKREGEEGENWRGGGDSFERQRREREDNREEGGGAQHLPSSSPCCTGWHNHCVATPPFLFLPIAPVATPPWAIFKEKKRGRRDRGAGDRNEKENTEKKNTEQRKGRTAVWHRHPLRAHRLTAAVSLRRHHQRHYLATPSNLLTLAAPSLFALCFLSFACRTWLTFCNK